MTEQSRAVYAEVLAAVEALPTRRLAWHSWSNDDGPCAVGCLTYGIDYSIDAVRYRAIQARYGHDPVLRDIVTYNDLPEAKYLHPHERWQRMVRFLKEKVATPLEPLPVPQEVPA